MKTKLTLILLFISFSNSFCQTKQDYYEYIKSHCEGTNPFNTTKTIIGKGSDILKKDAESFTGIEMTQEQADNAFYYVNKVYTNESKSTELFEVIRSCDLRGIRKVATAKKNNKEGSYYEITLYINSNYFCKEWGSVSDSIKNIESIIITVKVEESILTNIKKAFVNLAKLSGSNTVIDGDELFTK